MVYLCLPRQWRFESDTWRNRTDNPCVVSPHSVITTRKFNTEQCKEGGGAEAMQVREVTHPKLHSRHDVEGG